MTIEDYTNFDSKIDKPSDDSLIANADIAIIGGELLAALLLAEWHWKVLVLF